MFKKNQEYLLSEKQFPSFKYFRMLKFESSHSYGAILDGLKNRNIHNFAHRIIIHTY